MAGPVGGAEIDAVLAAAEEAVRRFERVDLLARLARERAAVAAILQYQPGQSDQMVNDYLRTARRARAIVDRVFWT